MKIGLIGQFAYECSIEKYYLRALKELGHRIVLDADSIISGAQKVDLTIVVKWFDHPEMLPHPRVLIFTDLTERFKEYYESIEQFYDYIFLVHPEKLVDNKRIFYLPVAYDPIEHTPLKRKKDIECLFLGTAHKSRLGMKQHLVIIRYGNGWGDSRAVYGAEKLELIARAKIALNMHYPKDETNMRLYECLAMQAFQLTDKPGPFKDGVDLVVYEDSLDILEKISYYLEHENTRERIAEHGYNTIMTGKYRYVDRIEELLKICGVG